MEEPLGVIDASVTQIPPLLGWQDKAQLLPQIMRRKGSPSSVT
jgi:hypothetical protein